jgi:hypothetical protein
MAYTSDGLRGGADGLRTGATAADAAGAVLQGTPVEPAMFGQTDAVAEFAAALRAAQAAHARGFRAESARADDLAQHTDAAAAAGDELTAGTAAVARAVPSPTVR